MPPQSLQRITLKSDLGLQLVSSLLSEDLDRVSTLQYRVNAYGNDLSWSVNDCTKTKGAELLLSLFKRAPGVLCVIQKHSRLVISYSHIFYIAESCKECK